MKLLIVLMLAGGNRISLGVSPQVCFEPCSIRVTIRIQEPTEEQVCVIVGKEEFYTSSCWPSQGRTLHQTHIKNIPQGEYEVGVRVGEDVTTAHLIVRGE